ncbi:MAG: hypothetical protein E6I26_00495 [Chloroflexi bacterium]|nr:MAG: hypothetical protein E6I26_00495 [Chloroflexota bacterium]
MRLSSLLVVAAIVGAAFGVAFVVASGPLLSVYGITLDKAGTLVAQLFGALLIGLAVLNWFARNVTDPEARQAVVYGNLVGDAIGFVVILIGQLAGIANAVGWSSVAIYLLLALGFAYVQVMQPRSA